MKLITLFTLLTIIVLVSCQNNKQNDPFLKEEIAILNYDDSLLFNKLEMNYVMNYSTGNKQFKIGEDIKKLKDSIYNELSRSSLNENKLTGIDKLFDFVLNGPIVLEKGDLESLKLKNEKWNLLKSDDINLKSNFQEHAKILIGQTVNFYLNCLINDIHIKDYRFNFIEPIVIENRQKLSIGDEYIAEIHLRASDTTANPKILIEGKDIPIINGKGIYKVPLNKRGNFKWTGEYIWVKPGNIEFIHLPIEGAYKVK